MKVLGPVVGSQTDRPAYENQFLRQQDLQLSRPWANQTHCAEARRPQSISNACNEKHIFLRQRKDNQQLNGGVNRSSLRGCSETNNTNLYQPPQLIAESSNKVTLKPADPLTQLLAVESISECTCVHKHLGP